MGVTSAVDHRWLLGWMLALALVAGVSTLGAPAYAAPPDRLPRPDRAASLAVREVARGRAELVAIGRRPQVPGGAMSGFSAAVRNGDGTYWAIADSRSDTVADPADVALRLYLIRPRWKRAASGSGRVGVLRHLTLSDPRHRISFPIVRESTRRRRLTAGDFDIASLQPGRHGSFWIGEEFGPYLLHVDRRGHLLTAPVHSPLGRSTHNPTRGHRRATIATSGGFEAMARSSGGRYLYPILEKARLRSRDHRSRIVARFDTRTGRYARRTWRYPVDTDDNLVADAQMVSSGRLLILERDDFAGEAAVTKRIYQVRLGRDDATGHLAKSLVVDLLALADPHRLAGKGRRGTGGAYSFGARSTQTLVPLPRGRLLVANGTDDPGRAARSPGLPGVTELLVIRPGNAVARPKGPTVIAHRGASGYRPEHTLAGYSLAIRQCVDVIEPDVVSTRDKVLVVRHENDISRTTDVSAHREFAARRRTAVIDGASVTGWFTEDFTLAELRTLRAVERLPRVRPANAEFDGLYPIPTLAEVLDLARHSRTCSGSQVGVAPEIKRSTYFSSIGLALEPRLLAALTRAALNRRGAPVVIQSFETGNLRALDALTEVRLMQLINCSGAPWDLRSAGDSRTYADLLTRKGLREIAGYADEVGVCKNLLIPRDRGDRLGHAGPVIRDAHAAGLRAVGWPFRRENTYLPANYRRGSDPIAPGDLQGEIRAFLSAGMDGLFTDNPDLAVAAAPDAEAWA